MDHDQSIFIEVKQRYIGCLFRRGATPYISQGCRDLFGGGFQIQIAHGPRQLRDHEGRHEADDYQYYDKFKKRKASVAPAVPEKQHTGVIVRYLPSSQYLCPRPLPQTFRQLPVQ